MIRNRSTPIAYDVRFGVGCLSPSVSTVDTVPGPVPTCPPILYHCRSDLSPEVSPSVPPAYLAPVPSHPLSREGTGDSPHQPTDLRHDGHCVIPAAF